MAEGRMRTTGRRFIPRPGTRTAPRPTRGVARRRLEADDPPLAQVASTPATERELEHEMSTRGSTDRRRLLQPRRDTITTVRNLIRRALDHPATATNARTWQLWGHPRDLRRSAEWTSTGLRGTARAVWSGVHPDGPGGGV